MRIKCTFIYIVNCVVSGKIYIAGKNYTLPLASSSLWLLSSCLDMIMLVVLRKREAGQGEGWYLHGSSCVAKERLDHHHHHHHHHHQRFIKIVSNITTSTTTIIIINIVIKIVSNIIIATTAAINVVIINMSDIITTTTTTTTISALWSFRMLTTTTRLSLTTVYQLPSH